MDIDANGRLSFLKIKDVDRDSLREFKPVLAQGIDEVLDEFYDHAKSNPLVAKFFTGKSIDFARQQQKRHWLENVFSGSFSEAYFQQVEKIGATHAAIGLEPRWYIAGYCLAVNKIIALINRHYRKKPERRDQIIEAVNKAVFLDMDIAISVYFHTLKESAANHLQNKGETFERDVVSTVVSGGVNPQLNGAVLRRDAVNESGPVKGPDSLADVVGCVVQNGSSLPLNKSSDGN